MKIIALEEHTVPQFIDHAWHSSAAKQDISLRLNTVVVSQSGSAM